MADRKPLRVAVSTWNVSAQDPPPSTFPHLLEPWLQADQRADLYAVALQEVVDINSPISYLGAVPHMLSAGPLTDLSAEAARWEESLADVLVPRCSLIARKQLVGLLLFVYVRADLAPDCAACTVSGVGTGPLGVANKGAVAASLTVCGSTICFVCAHLAAGSSGPAERNEMAAKVEAEMEFSSPTPQPVAPPATIGAHEFVLWMGDLNYRISLPADEARALAAAGDLETLAASDELIAERAAGRVFAGYRERALGFRPTYKYDLGSDAYDTSAKRRAPAWTDRVLWRTSEHASCEAYARHELNLSDHRPVSAAFTLSVAPATAPAPPPAPPSPPAVSVVARRQLPAARPAAADPCAALTRCLCLPRPEAGGYQRLPGADSAERRDTFM